MTCTFWLNPSMSCAMFLYTTQSSIQRIAECTMKSPASILNSQKQRQQWLVWQLPMVFVKLNFSSNSPSPCVLPMKLLNASVVNDLQLPLAVDNICSFDRSIVVVPASIGDIWTCQSFWKKKWPFFAFDERAFQFFKEAMCQFKSWGIWKIVLHYTH